MADAIQTRTRPITRDKLAKLFNGNQEMVRLVENLTQDVGSTLPGNIDVAAAAAEGAAGIADAAQATANSAQSNLNAHITDATDAHDASAIGVAPTAVITATDAQAAFEQLAGMALQAPNAVAVTGGTVLLASGAVGYAAGNGGVVVQATDKSTGVALDKICGEITLNAAALAAGAVVTFTLTNSTIKASDRVILNHKAGGTFMAYDLDAQPGAGSALIGVRNVTAGALAEAIVIGFAVVKSANS